VTLSETLAVAGNATEMTSEPLLPPAVAVIVEAPTATAVIKPFAETDAAELFDDAQLTV
jgi:hypothetical protein